MISLDVERILYPPKMEVKKIIIKWKIMTIAKIKENRDKKILRGSVYNLRPQVKAQRTTFCSYSLEYLG